VPEINHPFTPPCTVWTETFDFCKLALCRTRFRVNTHKNGELRQSDAVHTALLRETINSMRMKYAAWLAFFACLWSIVKSNEPRQHPSYPTFNGHHDSAERLCLVASVTKVKRHAKHR
jgi:hypothetical protein